MIIIITLLFFILPIISVPFILIGIFFNKKNRFKYCILLAVVLTIVAYYIQPTTNDDLYRNQLQAERYQNYDMNTILFSSTEQIRILIQLFVGKIQNTDLLQVICVFINYLLVFYILTDSQKKYNIKKSQFILIFLFTTLAFILVNIAGNLWNPMAISIFGFLIYMEYCKDKNKILCNILEIATMLIHSSMIFPILIKLLFEIFKRKNSKILVATIIIILLLIAPIINFLSDYRDLPIINEIVNFYNSYFVNDENYSQLHNIILILTYFTRIIPFVILYTFLYKERNDINNITMLYTFSIIALFISTTFAIRFLPLIQILGIPIIFSYFKNSEKKNNVMLYIYMLVITGGYIYYQYVRTSSYEFGTLGDKIFSNIYTIFIK